MYLFKKALMVSVLERQERRLHFHNDLGLDSLGLCHATAILHHGCKI